MDFSKVLILANDNKNRALEQEKMRKIAIKSKTKPTKPTILTNDAVKRFQERRDFEKRKQDAHDARKRDELLSLRAAAREISSKPRNGRNPLPPPTNNKRTAAPPQPQPTKKHAAPMDFDSLINLAKTLQHEPIKIPEKTENARPMTQAEKNRYLEERARKLRRSVIVPQEIEKPARNVEPTKPTKPRAEPLKALETKEFARRDLGVRLRQSKFENDSIIRQREMGAPNARRPKRRLDDDDDEDDEMGDFIDDGPGESGVDDYSKHIREIFGYDKRKYSMLDDDDCIESSFSRQMQEESYSARAGLREDLEDIKREKDLERQSRNPKKRKIVL